MVKRARLTDEGKDFLRSIDDAFCKPTPDTHLEPEIRDNCAICDQSVMFEYYGTQFHLGHRAFDMYNCPQCGGTRSFNPSQYWQGIQEKRRNR